EYRERLQRQLAGHTHVVMRKIILKAKAQPKRVVFPEGDHPKILRAAQILVDEEIARPILLGPHHRIEARARELELGDLLDRVEIINPREHARFEEFAHALFDKRQRKGVTLDHARRLMARRNY